MNTLAILTLSLFLGAGLTLLIALVLHLRKVPSPILPLEPSTFVAAGGRERRGYILRKLLAVLVTVAILVVNMNFYLQWVLKPGYTIRDTSREVGKLLKPDSLVMGQGVMPLLIETKIRYVQFPNWNEDGRTIFYDYPVTHLYLSHYVERIRTFKKHYPIVMKYSRVIATYKFWGKKFYLFELNIPPEERESAFKYR